jgi:thiol-disulfide isomerase/thioredoxin
MPQFRFSPVLPVLAAMAAPALLASAASAQDLKVGDAAPPIKVAKWVKGKPDNMTKAGDAYTLKPGSIHVVEFWATWCGPCKVSIPHLTDLAKKYKGKVTFTGVSINEGADNYLPKVAKFVTDMGPKMEYNVVADDKSENGTMSKSWMEAAAQEGIPTAFVIGKDAKIAWIGHPSEMDEPLAQVVAGKWDAKAHAAKAAKAEGEINRLKAVLGEVNTLARAGKFKEAVMKLDSFKSDNPEYQQGLAMTRLRLLQKADESEANVYAKQLAEGMFKDNPRPLNEIAWGMVGDDSTWTKPDYDVALAVAKRAVELTKSEDAAIMDTLAMAYYRKGNLDTAIETQEKAVALLSKGDFPAETAKELKDRLAKFKREKSGN